MCGMILEISLEDDGKRQTCETCRRRYDIHLTEDVTTGQKGVSLLYLTDGNRASGETSTVGSGTTSFQLPTANPASKTNPLGLLLEPDLPDEAHFKCSCGVLLSLPKAQYEKRSRCPACNARMMVFLLFDSSANAFTLQLFSLIDRTTGATQVLNKI